MTLVLSVAAHGSAGGGLPSGATAALLTLLSITVGMFVATMRAAADFRALVAVLAGGQLVGHALLASAGHSHQSGDAIPLFLMVAAHVSAIAVGAMLIAVGGRLCSALSRVLVAATRPTRPRVAAVSAILAHDADHPLQSARLLAASLSHRGPPVGFAH